MEIRTRLKRDCLHQALQHLGGALYRCDEQQEIVNIKNLMHSVIEIIEKINSKNKNNMLI